MGGRTRALEGMEMIQTGASVKELFNGVYRGRRVLVTGHTGFKGCWLTAWLLEMGAEVAGYALEPVTEPDLFSILNLRKRITHQTGDVRDPEALLRFCDDFRPEIVLHLAAQPLVRLSYREPVETYATNVMGTVHLLEAVRATPSVKSVVVVTSDKCYENREWVWGYRENEAMGGFDPYSSSKGCTELVVSAYRNSYFNNVESAALASGRAGNVIGGGDWAEDRLLPDCMRSMAAGQPVVLRNPEATRPWQHVLEPLSGYLQLGALLWQGESVAEGWNFGPLNGDVLRVEDVVQLVINRWGSGAYEVQSAGHPHEAMLLQLDISKAGARLQWFPVLRAAEAVAMTVDWYRMWYQSKDPEQLQQLTAEQINEYCRKAAEAGCRWTG